MCIPAFEGLPDGLVTGPRMGVEARTKLAAKVVHAQGKTDM